ncbi:hypothetical protein Slin_2498 [Spirosoma linguale DSM 74]|uniref:Uncharacterized protein n=1 Tax=Spirosoma linguale (strain ATCC 33905 / DSM 74 / LMG 10896 / Claus 1) TaxID=504472 RepID=D2QGK9_SPILD|nr:hypothetical protein Slin_2498 [Spirosoma linguale DSM 74]
MFFQPNIQLTVNQLTINYTAITKKQVTIYRKYYDAS